MKKTVFLAGIVVLWAFASGLTQPVDGPPTASPKQSILAGAGASPRVIAIVERSCQNCHSSTTQWPLYGRVYPMTLLINHDVQSAKSHMDLSRWPLYDDSRKRLILSEIGVVVRNGSMPPSRYKLLHPNAKLSADEA